MPGLGETGRSKNVAAFEPIYVSELIRLTEPINETGGLDYGFRPPVSVFVT